MILIHAVKMTVEVAKSDNGRHRKEIYTNQDVTFYTKGTKTEAVQELAHLVRLHKELGEPISYHLLHISDLGPFNEIEADLFILNANDLRWQIRHKQELVSNKE